MTDQFSMVALGTKFNNKDILNGTTPAYYDIQTGPDSTDNFTINVIEGATLASNLPSQSRVSSQSNAVTTMGSMPTVLIDIGEKMATVGASINRLLSSINNLSNASVVAERALGRIVDADYSWETQEMTKNMILAQSANQMIATANDLKKYLLQLIQ
jgi:flagellin-like hook-associated protein FlgL